MSAYVLVEVEVEAAHAWYYSDDYQAAAAVRQLHSRARMIAVEGTATA